MKIEDLYFPVEKISSSDLMPGLEFPSGISHAIQITTPEGVKRIVNFCSMIYHLVPNQEVMDPFLAEIKKFYKVETFIRTYGWSRFYVDFVLKHKHFNMGTDDLVFPRVRLVNSYDGAVKYSFILGFFRLVCSNGLMIPEGYVEKIKSMHTPKIGKETSFEKVMQMTSEFLAEADDHMETYRELADQLVKNVPDRVAEVIEETSFPQKVEEDVLYRIGEDMKRVKITVANDWLVYNGFNYQLNHSEDLKTKEHKKEKIDQEVLEYLLNY